MTEPNKKTWTTWLKEHQLMILAIIICLLIVLFITVPDLWLVPVFMLVAPYLSPELEFVQKTFAYLCFGFPFYIIPLIIVARWLAKKYDKHSLIYLIPSIPVVVIIACVIAYILLPIPEHYPEGYDKETFHVVNEEYDYYKADKNHVYFLYNKVEGANPQTFKTLSIRYGCDGKDYYFSGHPMHVSDYRSFRIINEQFWSIDKNFVYYTGGIMDDSTGISRTPISDYKSFKMLNDHQAQDKFQKYMVEDGNTLKALKRQE